MAFNRLSELGLWCLWDHTELEIKVMSFRRPPNSLLTNTGKELEMTDIPPCNEKRDLEGRISTSDGSIFRNTSISMHRIRQGRNLGERCRMRHLNSLWTGENPLKILSLNKIKPPSFNEFLSSSITSLKSGRKLAGVEKAHWDSFMCHERCPLQYYTDHTHQQKSRRERRAEFTLWTCIWLIYKGFSRNTLSLKSTGNCN